MACLLAMLPVLVDSRREVMIKELLILGAILILNTSFACVMVSAIQQRNINQVVTAMLHVEVCRHEGMRRIPCPR